MINLLLEMKQEVERAGGCLSGERDRQYERMYGRFLRYGAAYGSSFSKKEPAARAAKKPENCFTGYRNIKQKCSVSFVIQLFRLTITKPIGICV
jgi:hypothetical protein